MSHIQDTKVRGIVKRDDKEYDLRVSFAPYSLALGDKEAMQKQAQQALDIVSGLPCNTPEEYEACAGLLKSCKAQVKGLEATRKKIGKPLLDAKREIDGWLKPAIDLYGACEKSLKAQLLAYQDRHQTALEASAATIAQAHVAGDYGAVLAVTGALQALPEVEGISTRETWAFEILDPVLVPREFLTVDATKVNAAIKAGVRDIPGIRVFTRAVLAATASK